MRPCALISVIFLLLAMPSHKHPAPSIPDHFEVGVDTFFDFGPPLDYYDIFVVRSNGGQTDVEDVSLTPHGASCLAHARVEIKRGSIPKTIGDLLEHTNPCAIPEKELQKELKRRKHLLTFSGMNVVLQFKCGAQSRSIRADVLDRDIYAAAPGTPEHTSWTMRLLSQLRDATGPGPAEQPVRDSTLGKEVSSVDPSLPFIVDLAAGKYDALFLRSDQKMSDLFRETQNPPPAPTVNLYNISPVPPEEMIAPVYPRICILAHVQGRVVVGFAINSEGKASHVWFVYGPPLLRNSVEAAVTAWKFPPSYTGQAGQATFDFALHCHD